MNKPIDSGLARDVWPLVCLRNDWALDGLDHVGSLIGRGLDHWLGGGGALGWGVGQ